MIVIFFYKMIRAGLLKIEDVPGNLQPAVQAMLDADAKG